MATERETTRPRLKDELVTMNVVPEMAFQPFAHLDGLNDSAATQIQVESIGAMVLQVWRLSSDDLAWPNGQTIILLGTLYDRPPESPVGLAVMTPPQGPPLPRATLKITNGGGQEEVKLHIRPPQEKPGRYSTTAGHEGPVVMLEKHLQSLSVTITNLPTNV